MNPPPEGNSLLVWALRRPFAVRLLRMPLSGKLVIANAVTLVLLGAGAVLVTSRVVRVGSLDAVAAIEILGVGVLALSALANALVIRLALSPLAGLEDAALRVQRGDPTARAPASPLADEDLERVITLFNQVLDWVEADRVRRTELSLRVLQAEERERERLGRALYAEPAQTLAGVLVRMRLAERTGDPAEVAAILAEVRDEVAAALDEIRRMARRLHPPELSEIGVAAALEAHARYLVEELPMQITFEGSVPEAQISADARLVLFRIVQEALSNAVLHSEGRRVHTRFTATPQGLLTEVMDDGRGFNPDRQLLSGAGGLGLLGMRERAGYVSAQLTLETRVGEGTRVRLLIPWSSGPGTRPAPGVSSAA